MALQTIDWLDGGGTGPNGQYELNAENLNKMPKDFADAILAKDGNNYVQYVDESGDFPELEGAYIVKEAQYAVSSLYADTAEIADRLVDDNYIVPEADHAETTDFTEIADTADTIESGGFYDRIIMTQTEFEDMINHPTWFDAEAVAIKGNVRVPSNKSLIIPSNVLLIEGISANYGSYRLPTIAYTHNTATTYLLKDENNVVVLKNIRLSIQMGFANIGVLKLLDGFKNVSDVNINITATSTNRASIIGVYGILSGERITINSNLSTLSGTNEADTLSNTSYFENCKNVRDCSVVSTTTSTSLEVRAFKDCQNLLNCQIGAGSTRITPILFLNCKNMVGCKDTNNGQAKLCNQVFNCAFDSVAGVAPYLQCRYGSNNVSNNAGTKYQNCLNWSLETNR